MTTALDPHQDNNFPTGALCIPAQVARDTELKPSARLLYGFLLQLTTERGPGPYTSLDDLVPRTGMSRPQVQRFTSQLEAAGYLQRVRDWEGVRYYLSDRP